MNPRLATRSAHVYHVSQDKGDHHSITMRGCWSEASLISPSFNDAQRGAVNFFKGHEVFICNMSFRNYLFHESSDSKYLFQKYFSPPPPTHTLKIEWCYPTGL